MIRRIFFIGLATFFGLAGLLLAVEAMRPAAMPDSQASEPARVHAMEASTAIINYPNCRFGIGGSVVGYSVTALNVGVYMDWSARLNPVRPNGAEYLQLVTLRPGPNGGYVFTPTAATLQAIMAQNPGAIWLIGNEPDSPWNDDLHAEDYARAYHDLYGLIKQHNPSARIGAGNIVQPTPLRFQYLDRVLNTYQQLYGKPMPVDLWSIHTYILREIDRALDSAWCLVAVGTNPENGRFFVATKSAFNKNPKINYTHEDIEKNHGHAPGLVEKLKAALTHLPKSTPKKGVFQGGPAPVVYRVVLFAR